MILALGELVNMETPPNNAESKMFFAKAQEALFHGQFLTYNTLTGVQTLVSLGRAKLMTVHDGQICRVSAYLTELMAGIPISLEEPS